MKILKFQKDNKVLHARENDKKFIEYLIKQGYTEVQEKKK